MTVLATERAAVAPATVAVAGGWTTHTGGSDLVSAVDEAVADDGDYIQSTEGPSNETARLKLAALNASAIYRPTLRYRLKRSGADVAITQTVRLYQGGGSVVGAGTLIGGPWVHNVVDFTTFEQAIDRTLISDGNDLYVELEAA